MAGAFWFNDAGMQMLHATNGLNSSTADILNPARGNPTNATDKLNDWGCVRGVHALFCDGHVQLVSDSIESNTASPSWHVAAVGVDR